MFTKYSTLVFDLKGIRNERHEHLRVQAAPCLEVRDKKNQRIGREPNVEFSERQVVVERHILQPPELEVVMNQEPSDTPSEAPMDETATEPLHHPLVLEINELGCSTDAEDSTNTPSTTSKNSGT